MRVQGTQWIYFVLSLLLVVPLNAQREVDSSNHAVQMIPVEKDVSLEVFDRVAPADRWFC